MVASEGGNQETELIRVPQGCVHGGSQWKR